MYSTPPWWTKNGKKIVQYIVCLKATILKNAFILMSHSLAASNGLQRPPTASTNRPPKQSAFTKSAFFFRIWPTVLLPLSLTVSFLHGKDGTFMHLAIFVFVPKL